MSDNIVEGDEMFSMSLNVPSSLDPGIVAGSVTSATGIIVDSSSKGYLCKRCILTIISIIGIMVRFTQDQYTGSENTETVLVTLELVGGTSSKPFDVTVTPLEQSPVSAGGNSVYDNVLIEGCLTNRWC